MSNKKYSDIKQMDHTRMPMEAHFSFRKKLVGFNPQPVFRTDSAVLSLNFKWPIRILYP
jgi:hypothetical protein